MITNYPKDVFYDMATQDVYEVANVDCIEFTSFNGLDKKVLWNLIRVVTHHTNLIKHFEGALIVLLPIPNDCRIIKIF